MTLTKLLPLTFAAILLLSACSGNKVDTAGSDSGSTAAFSQIAETSDARFERDVIDSDEPVLVDFYATWCRPCREMQPVLEDLAKSYKHKVKVVRVDVEKNPRIATRYRIEAIPRLMLFKNGDLVDDKLGVTTRESLSSTIDRTL
jgi:thioredoxin 1